MKLNNPFLVYGYNGPTYFCDREQETSKMTSALHNERNLTLIAPRRMGKTGLIKNVFHHIGEEQKDILCFYLDIYSTRDLKAFVQLLAQTVLGHLDSLSQSTLKEIFDYIAHSGKRCYIAIDEFQQITEYPEQGVEALLRSYIQFVPNVHFVFAGSKMHLMEEMFTSAKRPFYQSTQLVLLKEIPQDTYYAFANHFFKEVQRELPQEAFRYLYALVNGHTWYMQVTLNRLYEMGGKNISNEQVDNAIRDILEEQEPIYQNSLNLLTANQVGILKAIAMEGCVKSVNSNEFIRKYQLKTPSSVNVAVKSLLNKELLYVTPDGYIVYDRFMSRWLKEAIL